MATFIKNITGLIVWSLALSQGAHAHINTVVQKNDNSKPGDIHATASESSDWCKSESLLLKPLGEGVFEESGFSPFAFWQGEFWCNLGGGVKSGSIGDSLFTLGFEQDLSVPAGVRNMGSIGMSFFYYWQSDDFTAKRVGSLSDPSNIFAGDMTRIFEIYYSNEFQTRYGLLKARIGQLSADEDFMTNDYASVFLNSNFGAIPANCGDLLYDGNLAFSQYPLATAGITLAWEADNFNAMLGVYNGSCGLDTSSNHGFDYDIHSVAVWYQVGYSYTLFGREGVITVGGNWHGGEFLNYKTNLPDGNFHSFYAILQQSIISSEEGDTVLGAFARAAWAPDENISSCTKYFDCGFNWFAPLPSRKEDILALGYSFMEIGEGLRNCESLPRHADMAELTYKMQITKFMSLQPVFQTYFNAVDSSGETRTAYVAGLRAEINF